MRAARNFARLLVEDGLIEKVDKIDVEICGSLAATGLGHHTPNAIIGGLQGYKPNNYSMKKAGESGRFTWFDLTGEMFGFGDRTKPEIVVDLPIYDSRLSPIVQAGKPSKTVKFSRSNFIFNSSRIHPLHTNSMVIRAFNTVENECLPVRETTYLSVGGGEVLKINNDGSTSPIKAIVDAIQIAAPAHLGTVDETDYLNADELLDVCNKNDLTIAQVARKQEQIHYGDEFSHQILDERLDLIWQVMNDCIEEGLKPINGESDSMLCPELNFRARAPKMHERMLDLKNAGRSMRSEKLSCYALAVNEQNAVGGRIVTAPTAGSAGVIPSVLRFWVERYGAELSESEQKSRIREFILSAGVIGSIIKRNASISGAECGCQAEIGSACAMAAAGFVAAYGGTPSQVESAAESALEYHLGLTCDPVKGLVFIPCIERNAMAANTAVVAAELALGSDGSHIVSLDTAIETMRQTGLDMNAKYKETSKGGLATYVAC
jgi:L-serine dehydratase